MNENDSKPEMKVHVNETLKSIVDFLNHHSEY